MGRHRKATDPSKHDVRKQETVSDPSEAVEERLFGHLICESCNARNPKEADKCRKCGHNKLRKKKDQYADA